MKTKLIFTLTLIAMIYAHNRFSEMNVLANGDSYNKYEFLVPKQCQQSVMSDLRTFQLEDQIDFNYTKLYEQGDLFENIVGIVTLFTTEKHDYVRLLNFKSEIISKCYPNTVLSFAKNSSGWRHFAETVEKLEKENIDIQSIQIDRSYVKILYYKAE